MARRVETVLLDAGGVLLDLDYACLRRLIESRGLAVELSALSRAESLARREIDRRVREGGRVGRNWRDYFRFLLADVGLAAVAHDAIIDSLWEAHQRVGLWTVPIDGALETVRGLTERGFRVGVVSNAEGRVAEDLDRAGFTGMFEVVIDSHLVGVEKPDPAIFRIALERLGASASNSVFVGDLPAVDVVGARNAGLAALLLDRHDQYPEEAVRRLRTIDELLAVLDAGPIAD